MNILSRSSDYHYASYGEAQTLLSGREQELAELRRRPNATPAIHNRLCDKTEWDITVSYMYRRLRTTAAQIASENPSWGYTRIHGALRNLDIKVGRGTIRRILKDHLIEPAPARGRHIPWSMFLKAHWKAIVASDFFTVEVWSWHGLVTRYVLYVIELATRRVTICGITTNPDEVWMLQIARGALDSESGVLRGKEHLIVDRDTKYTVVFRTFLARKGVEVIRLPPRSPNLDAYAERFIRSVKSECLSKLIPIGPSMREYMEHYHWERNPQGLDNKLITSTPVQCSKTRRIDCRSRLGGILWFYERAVA